VREWEARPTRRDRGHPNLEILCRLFSQIPTVPFPVHSHEAEVVGSTSAKVKLLVDSNATGGAPSTVQFTLKAERGDVIVVPPRLPHAFAAARGKAADLLIVIAPGVERFEYFRKLTRIARGEEPPESLRDVQQIYDTYFSASREWEAARR
jgi:hypothetical protein